MTPGKQYVAVAWADFVTAGSQADLHYDTSDFTNITCLDDVDARLNDESRDAYAVSQSFEVGNDALNLDLTLKRLFAKLRIVTTDWNLEGVDKPNKIELTYDNCYDGLSLNIIESSSTSTASTRTYTVDLAEEKDYQLNYDAADCNRTIAVDYLIDSGSGYSYAHFTLKTYNDDTLLTTKTVDTDIPLRSNWLTTVMGNLFSTNSQITVECDEMFDDEANIVISGSTVTATEPESVDNVYYVSNAAELLWISENTTTLRDATVKLTADIDLDGINWTPIISYNKEGEFTYTYTYFISEFDGQDHTIYNLYIGSDWETADAGDSLGLFGKAAGIIIKNVTLQNVSIDFGKRYVGGLVGLLGELSAKENIIENCKVNNFFSRPLNYNQEISDNSSSCIGAVIGTCCYSLFKIIDCHANNVDINGNISIGGLVGSCYSSSDTSSIFKDCSVVNATLWEYAWYFSVGLRWSGALLRLAGGNGTYEVDNCSSSNITYKYLGVTVQRSDNTNGYYNYTFPLLTLKSGDEGIVYTYHYDWDLMYGPMTALTGYVESTATYIEN